jgi:hypothetical protein
MRRLDSEILVRYLLIEPEKHLNSDSGNGNKMKRLVFKRPFCHGIKKMEIRSFFKNYIILEPCYHCRYHIISLGNFSVQIFGLLCLSQSSFSKKLFEYYFEILPIRDDINLNIKF